MWICPNCNRGFRAKNQSHSCAVYSFDAHFANKSPVVKATFNRLTEVVDSIGEVNINVLRSAIFLKTDSTFLEIKVKKDYLIIAFFMDTEINEFPVSSTLQISRNRIVHTIHLEKPEDITPQIIAWLEHSYKLKNPLK